MPPSDLPPSVYCPHLIKCVKVQPSVFKTPKTNGTKRKLSLKGRNVKCLGRSQFFFYHHYTIINNMPFALCALVLLVAFFLHLFVRTRDDGGARLCLDVFTDFVFLVFDKIIYRILFSTSSFHSFQSKVMKMPSARQKINTWTSGLVLCRTK